MQQICRKEHKMKNNILIHVPHSSLYIPEEYRRTSLLSRKELEEENRFMCDTGVKELIPEALKENAVIFPYSRLYCDVERFRDGSEPMEAYGMGFVYIRDSRGRELFDPTEEHIREVSQVYDEHHETLNRRAEAILQKYGSCIIVDLHSYSDEAVDRLFGYRGCPDVCIGTEPGYYSESITEGIIRICDGLGLSTKINYPYKGSLVPNAYFGKENTGIVSVMLEINKRILGEGEGEV